MSPKRHFSYKTDWIIIWHNVAESCAYVINKKELDQCCQLLHKNQCSYFVSDLVNVLLHVTTRSPSVVAYIKYLISTNLVFVFKLRFYKMRECVGVVLILYYRSFLNWILKDLNIGFAMSVLLFLFKMNTFFLFQIRQWTYCVVQV